MMKMKRQSLYIIIYKPLQLSGGRAIRYSASIITEFSKLSIQQSDPITKEEGIKIGFTVKKNHVITNKYPYVHTEYYGIFGIGTEKYLELIQLAIEQGFLVKAGAFLRIPDANGDPEIRNGEKMQWQGMGKFRQYCLDNPDFFNELKSKVSACTYNLSEEQVKQIEEEEKQIKEEVEAENIDIIEEAKKEKKKSKK